MLKRKKILIFGAGKIGRSFIGQLFSLSGYSVVFVDVDPALVNLLNEKSSYTVFIVDSRHPELENSIRINHVRALHTGQAEAIESEIINTDIIATSVGKSGLRAVSALLATGIRRRMSENPGGPIDIIIAENVRNADSFLRNELEENGLQPFPADYVGLVETSIGKMVPIMTDDQMRSDPLSVYAEPYNTLILDAVAFRNPVPDVAGLSPKQNMKAWVDRKLFIHNLGHAALAYQANYNDPGLNYTWKALEVRSLKLKTRDTMLQSARILLELYPEEFTEKQLEEHVDNLLERFANKALGDTIFRVGCDLKRKLGGEDRLMVPLLTGIQSGLPTGLILEAWVKGCSFRAADENGKELPADVEFRKEFGNDYDRILAEHCGLKPEIADRIREQIDQLNQRRTFDKDK
jgi:mannitol-1-phosphate 5-dehydrogenase